MENRFTQRLQNISGKDLTAILSKIARIDEFKGWWKGSSFLNPQALGRLKQTIIITSTGASTRIEGSSLSDKEVEKLLKGLRVSKLKDRDSQEVAGYAEVLQLVFDSYKDINVTEGVILQLHGMLLKHSVKDQSQKGRYKSSANQIVAFDKVGGQAVLFNPTEPHLTAPEMRELLEWTHACLKSGEFHPILVVANFIVEFLAIHPFHDGNGRLSRILTNLLLARTGYTYVPYASLEKIIEDHKTEYYLALRTAQKNIKSPKAEIAPWIHFFLNVMIRQVEVLQGLLKKSPNEAILSENQLKTLKLFEKNKVLTNRIVSESLLIPSVTAKQILGRLVELKLINRFGSGRSTRYQKN